MAGVGRELAKDWFEDGCPGLDECVVFEIKESCAGCPFDEG